MIVRLFKSNQPFLLFLLPVIALFMWVYGFIYPTKMEVENIMPLYQLTTYVLDNSLYLSSFIGLALLIAEAYLISYIVNEHEITLKRTYLPGLIYIILVINNANSLQLSSTLIANLFLLFAINRLLHIYRREDTFSEVFDAGFLIAIATLFYLPSVAFLLVIFIGLLLFHPFVWREWLITLIGFTFPFLLLFTYYYLSDNLDNMPGIIPDEYKTNAASYDVYFFMLTGIVALILVLSFFSMITSSGGIKLKAQKSISFNNWYLLIAIIAFVVSALSPIAINLMALPLSLIFANYFLSVKKNWWAELLLALLVIASLMNVYH